MRRLLGLLAAGTVLAGCRGGLPSFQSRPPRPPVNRRPRVALVLPNLTDPFFAGVRDGALAAASEAQIDLRVQAPAGAGSAARQSEILSADVDDAFRAILVLPADPRAAAEALKRVAPEEVAVIAIEQRVESHDRPRQRGERFFAVDHDHAGRLAAEHIGQLLDGRGQVALLRRSEEAAPAVASLSRGFSDALEGFPGMELLDPPAKSSSDAKDAGRTLSTMLETYPDLRAAFCADSDITREVVRNLRRAERRDRLFLVAYGNTLEIREALAGGWLHAVVDPRPDRLGYEAVRYAGQRLRGGKKRPGNEWLRPELVTPGTLTGK